MFANDLHMACGGFEALSCPPKPKLATVTRPKISLPVFVYNPKIILQI